MVAYFLPILSGAHKVYSTPDSSFWCCVGTGFENHAKYGEAIYYHKNNDLFVNLFIPSELDWNEKGVSVKQETEYPKNGQTTLKINAAKTVSFTLKLRYPSWAKSAVVKVNGKKRKIYNKPGSYIAINRSWNDGDLVEIEYPMSVEIHATPENANVVSFSFGPIVLAAKMGTEGMEKPAPFSNSDLHNDYYTYEYHIPEGLTNKLNLKGKNIEKLVEKNDDTLEFRIKDSENGQTYEMIPLYDLHRERYIVYWELQ